MGEKLDKFKEIAVKTVAPDGKVRLTRAQTGIIFAVLMVLAVLLGTGIRALLSDDEAENIDSQGKTFVEENITFNRVSEGVQVQKGDLIIFKRDNALDGYLIKRVIAVQGETVNIDDNGIVYVNGQQYWTDKQYYRKDIPMPVTVPEGELFVLGDNGDESVDSRITYVGNVRIDEVEGIAAAEE